MSEYPDPDEEFEIMYEDELEMMKSMNEVEEDFTLPHQIHPSSRRSLNFKSPAPAKSAASSSSTPASVTSPSTVAKLTFEPVAGPSWLDDSIIYAEDDNKKRKVDYLFGDIDDIDDIEQDENIEQNWAKRKRHEPPQKRSHKPLQNRNHEPPQKRDSGDEELMRKIVLGRKQQQAKFEFRATVDNSTKKTENLSISKHVPKWPFVSVTTSAGGRWYLRLHSEEYFEQQIKDAVGRSQTGSLLSVPYDVLWQEAQTYLQQKSERDAAVAFEKRLQALEDSSADSGCELMSEDEERGDKIDLWVEKYKPKSYVELLSDENLNRTLLQWLRLWDKIVFNRERKIKPKAFKEEKKVPGSVQNRFQKKSVAVNGKDDLDEHGCPRLKMALLCGPPGLGKTTLAHLIARHAGYNVVEMNASDDRSPDVFRNMLETATQMRSVMGEEPKPNCLIIDEIDGAAAASIEVLVKYATGKDVGKGRGKKKGKTGVVRRPMICICNDLYVPALRPLRQLAFILRFPPTASSRLAQRLLEIARKQRICTDLSTMMALAEKSKNDIRSCLSVLQFFKSRGKNVRLVDVHRTNVGQKDMQKGLFAVWHSIFQIERPKRSMTNIPPKDSCNELIPMPDLDSPPDKFGPLSLAARMRNILQNVQSYGDYELLSQGVFENYLNMKLRDSRMEGVVLGLEWFCTVDNIMNEVYARQNYVLMPYLPYAFVVWHFLFSSFHWPQISFPSAAHEASAKMNRSRGLVEELMKGMHPSIKANTHDESLVFDTIPLMMDLLVPNLRPVSLQLYSKREREDLNEVINIMIDYNLNYVQERTDDGSFVFNLDPNIEEFCTFPGSKTGRTLSYSIKQLLSREVELERVKRVEQKAWSGAAETVKTKPKTTPEEGKQPVVPNHLKKLEPEKIAETTRVARDFFGRPVERKQTFQVPQKGKPDNIVKSDIWFHFKEGFSNAVRRSVKMKDLQ